MAEEPRAWYRPRREAFLQVFTDDERRELELDEASTDLPPHWDPRRSKPPIRARVDRFSGGYRLVPLPGAQVRINNRAIQDAQVLRGGDEIVVESFYAVFTTARQELPWPMTVVVWPPEGPPVEVRTHRTRISIGARDADLIVDDETLDATHCTITRFRNGTMKVEDHRSYNGTYVDGRQVDGTGSLRDGAEIRVGYSRMKAWADAPEAGATAAKDNLVGDAAAHPEDEGLPDPAGDPWSPDAFAREPLEPMPGGLGPRGRRRTFDDEIPTRLETWGETVDVRRQRRPSGEHPRIDPAEAARAYHAAQEGGGGDADEWDQELPEWAPAKPENRPQAAKRKRAKKKGRSRADDPDWDLKSARGLTWVHEPDHPPDKRRD